MREHRILLLTKPAKREPKGSRELDGSSACATPRKGRRPGAVPSAPWPGFVERLWFVAPFLFGGQLCHVIGLLLPTVEWPEYEKIWKYDLTQGVISIGWTKLGDVSSLNWDELLQHYHQTYPDDSDAQAKIACRMLYNFYREVKPGDKVIARKGVKRLAAVGTVTKGAYYDSKKHMEPYPPDEVFSDHLDVKWDDSPRDKQFDRVVFGMFTIYEIDKDRFDEFTVDSSGTEPKAEEEGVEDQQEFILEKYLQDFIVANFRHIFKDQLQIYEIEGEGSVGQQFHTSDPDVGIIDVLAQDLHTNDFVVIELKKGRESDKVVGQIIRYMGWVKEKLCSEGQEVYGIIICKDYDERLRLALKVVKNVSVKCYRVDFKLLDQQE